MTKLEFVNKIFFQWLFIRLTKCQERRIYQFDLNGVSLLPTGNMGVEGRLKESITIYWYSIQGFILPCSGWRKSFVFISKRWLIRVTKKKVIKEQK